MAGAMAGESNRCLAQPAPPALQGRDRRTAFLAGAASHSPFRTMFPQLFQLAGAQKPSLLVFIDLSLATLSGASGTQILRRERRRLLRREAEQLRRLEAPAPAKEGEPR